ncbi:hypothetical protein EV126DRAFT_138885 [Verticillium dahliae]|nr:hypothetical protein EV126DRAFT_138885 [Verticillium dahliae]
MVSPIPMSTTGEPGLRLPVRLRRKALRFFPPSSNRASPSQWLLALSAVKTIRGHGLSLYIMRAMWPCLASPWAFSSRALGQGFKREECHYQHAFKTAFCRASFEPHCPVRGFLSGPRILGLDSVDGSVSRASPHSASQFPFSLLFLICCHCDGHIRSALHDLGNPLPY